MSETWVFAQTLAVMRTSSGDPGGTQPVSKLNWMGRASTFEKRIAPVPQVSGSLGAGLGEDVVRLGTGGRHGGEGGGERERRCERTGGSAGKTKAHRTSTHHRTPGAAPARFDRPSPGRLSVRRAVRRRQKRGAWSPILAAGCQPAGNGLPGQAGEGGGRGSSCRDEGGAGVALVGACGDLPAADVCAGDPNAEGVQSRQGHVLRAMRLRSAGRGCAALPPRLRRGGSSLSLDVPGPHGT